MSKGVFYILLSMGFIGASIPLGGELMTKFPVWLFTCITIGAAAIILIPIATVRDKTKWTKLGKKNYFGIFMQALLTCTLYTVLLLYGLTYASAVSVGIITSITPAVVFILAFFLLKEKLNKRKFISIALAVLAVLIMNIAGVQGDGGSNIGIVFMLLAVVSLSLFFIYAKKFAVTLPAFTLSAVLCTWGFIQTLPMAIYEFQTFNVSLITAGDWGRTLLYAVLSWALAYTFTYFALPTIKASTAGMATAVIPIVAVIGGVAFYGASMRTVDVIALILVITSIFIAESQEKRAPLSVTAEDAVEAK